MKIVPDAVDVFRLKVPPDRIVLAEFVVTSRIILVSNRAPEASVTGVVVPESILKLDIETVF